jgi:hypothetical protein
MNTFVACVASSTDWRQRYRSIWHCDFEYREDANHLPVPVCMVAIEEHTGASIVMRRAELLKCSAAPFGTGPDDLMVAYAANAELSCFLARGWPFPVNVLDVYVEVIAAINGNTAMWPNKGRPGLLDALDLYGLEGVSRAYKDHWRNVILSKPDGHYSEEEWAGIETYNRTDVDETIALLGKMWRSIDLPRALMRGRYMGAVARMERVGLPIDVGYFAELQDAFEAIKLHYIERDDHLHMYEGTTFCEERLFKLIEARGWDWPRTPTGRYELKRATIGKQATRYPELKPLARLRDQIAELRLNKFANTIGADGFSRCPIMPFWTKTGRNQPQAHDKMFLPGLPTWLHGLIKPPPGFAIFELDFRAEEVGIMAGLSGDPGMIEDYLKEPYLEFARRAGLIPPDVTPKALSEIRNTCKPVVLGQNYGMTKYGIARKTGKSLLWARDIAARHRQAYPVFHSWLADVVAQAQFDGFIQTPYGFPMAVTEATSNRTIMNFPAQGAGADLLRLTAIAATEAGICIAALVHDALWAMAPLAALDATIAKLTEIMIKASTLVTGGLPIGVTVEAIVRWPDCLGDVRKDDDKGQKMWREIDQLVHGGELRQRARG